jgi:hypothetical protein
MMEDRAHDPKRKVDPEGWAWLKGSQIGKPGRYTPKTPSSTHADRPAPTTAAESARPFRTIKDWDQEYFTHN